MLSLLLIPTRQGTALMLAFQVGFKCFWGFKMVNMDISLDEWNSKVHQKVHLWRAFQVERAIENSIYSCIHIC